MDYFKLLATVSPHEASGGGSGERRDVPESSKEKAVLVTKHKDFVYDEHDSFFYLGIHSVRTPIKIKD